MLIGFQALALRTSLLDTESVALGIFSVIAGLMVFTEGVKYGLMPFAENVGFQMPGRTHPAVLLSFSLLLGAAATFAEPAIGALQAAASAVSPERSPWLRQLLGPYVLWLVLAVAGGVGLAVMVGMLRMMFGWPLKKMVLLIVPPALALTAWCAQQPELAPIIGLAWDCGAITTGPVTVPLVLAVGVGVAASTGRSDNPLSGFGIVTLASLFPVLAVLCVAIYLTNQGAGAMLPVLPPSLAGWDKETPYAETIGALRAIVPLVLLLVLVQTLLLRQKIRQPNVFIYGISTALAGMVLFNLGLTAGLVALGEQAGTNVPWAFSTHRVTGAPALYPFVLGIAMTMVFAFAIGYGATVAEPALNAMGMTVENLTNGIFRKRMLIHAVAVGVGVGAAWGSPASSSTCPCGGCC
jgi:nitrate reductase NapE component